MATLEKIRSKAGLLVGVVGLALFAFIIGDFLNSGSTFFRQRKETVLTVEGQSIGFQDFQAKVSEMEEIYKMSDNKTLIVIAHRLSTVERCDRRIKIENGSIVGTGV